MAYNILKGNPFPDGTSPPDGYFLAWNGAGVHWEARPGPSGSFSAGGDLTGSSSSQTVIALRGKSLDVSLASLSGPEDNYVLTWLNSDGYWAARVGGSGSFTAGGDLSGSSSSQTVIKINGASVPAAGALTTGNVLQVNGVASLTYAPVNLAGGANFVTGSLPTANQVAQSMGGDVTGTTAASTVIKINGTSVSASPSANQVLVATSSTTSVWSLIYDGYVAAAAAIAGSKIQSTSTSNLGVIQIGGDLDGTATSQVVRALQTRTVNAAVPNDTDVLTWDQADGYWVPRPPSSGSSPSGPAGGDLSGTYPNPVVAKIQTRSVNSVAPDDGYVLTWDQADGYWVPRPAPTASPVPDATASVKGIIKLTGDLNNTADSPSVVKLKGVNLPVDAPVANQVLVATSATTLVYSQIFDGYVAATANIAGSKIQSTSTSNLGVIQIGGDLDGTSTSQVVRGLQTRPVNSAVPTDGYVLTWDQADGYWVPRRIPNSDGYQHLSITAGVAPNIGTGSNTFARIGSVRIDTSNYIAGSTYIFSVIFEATTSQTAEIRLYNVTDSAVVSGSTLSTTVNASDFKNVAVSLSGAKIYEAELRITNGSPTSTDGAICSKAEILVRN